MVLSSQPGHERARLVALPSPTLAQADDATLARAVSAGDPRAASVLWDRFSPLVRRVLRRTLGPRAHVEPLLQQVFVRVVGELGGLSESAQLRPFVVAHTVRVLTTQLKRHRWRRLFGLAPPWQRAEQHEASGDATTRSALVALYGILDRLDADARLAFTLRHFEGLAMAELASATDATLSSAKRRLARASARVRVAAARDPALNAYSTAAGLGDAP